jgi:hypothetical protein
VAAARGLPIPPPDQIPPELEYAAPLENTADASQPPDKSTQFLAVPTSARPSSAHSEVAALPTLSPAQSLPSPSPVASGTSTSPLFRSRAKTLAALTHSNKNSPAVEPSPREFMLTHDPFVNGQPIEAYLYKDASECPICFIYYPPYLNHTRCCDQPICSECFVQIKRPDPHPPEHGEPQDQNADRENGTGAGEDRDEAEQESQLVSEPSACPFCVQPEFGVTYAPPQFRRGLTYAVPNGLASGLASPVSSSSSLGSMGSPAPPTGRRRATSLSASDPSVITTDKVRPDWAQKLANARAHAARRSAAATALHTAAYLMNSPGSEIRSFGRRGMLRRAAGSTSSGTQTPTNRPPAGPSPALHALAFLSERRVVGEQTNEPSTLAPPRESSRRSRIDDLEEMMMMEAIRMSLASEEERRRKEEKELRKEAKKKEKEAKKAEKVMRKNASYSNSQASLAILSSGASSRVDSSSSSFIGEDQSNSDNKGKKVDRASSVLPTVTRTDATDASGPSTAQKSAANLDSVAQASPTEPSRPSHLRHVSSASSTSSSFAETGAGDHPDANASSSNTSAEPMFNFRSLAAVIGDEEKSQNTEHAGHAEHAEHVEDTAQQQSSATANTDDTTPTISPTIPPTKEETQPPKTEDDAAPIQSPSRQEHEHVKELNAHSVEVPRETTV